MMISELYEQRQYMQEYIETLAEVTGFDIYMADQNMLRVAGTGMFKETIGMNLPAGCVTEYVLKGKSEVLLFDPLENPICQSCPIKDADGCFKEFSINLPILREEVVYGCFSIAAIRSEQKEQLQKKKEEITRWARLICDNFVDKIEGLKNERKLGILHYLAAEGIVTVNWQGEILSCNNRGKAFMGNEKNIIRILLAEDADGFDEFKEKAAKGQIPVEIMTEDGILPVSVTGQPVNPQHSQSDFIFLIRHRKEIDEILSRISSTEASSGQSVDNIRGNSTAILRAKELAIQAAQYNSNVLLLGESGTGKELFAKYIHNSSERSAKSFIPVNCAAIPENLLESELFGYEQGAFTSAKATGKPGKFELANGGTLFLDEIGEMPLHLQPKLLRAIETNVVERIGSVKPIQLDLKIITATNRDLEDMVEAGTFRKDLFYRLCVFPISIPALRERPEDIVSLAEWFVRKYSMRFRKNIAGLEDAVKRELLLYSWPGNVRELENAIEYAVNVEPSKILTLESLPQKYVTNKFSTYEDTNLEAVKRACIINLMVKYGKSVEGKKFIAKEMGISLSTLYRYMKEYHL